MATLPPLPPTNIELPDLSTNPPWVAADVVELFTKINDWADATDTTLEQFTTWLTGFGDWQTYIPEWKSSETSFQPAIGNGTLTGRYRRLGPKTLLVQIWLFIGSSTVRGRGDYTFGLPSGVSAGDFEQIDLNAVLTRPGIGWFHGYGNVAPAASVITPFFQVPSLVWARARNSDASGNVGTGVPQITGTEGFAQGCSLSIQGIVRTS